MSNARNPLPKTTAVRFRLKDEFLTSQEMLHYIMDPEQSSKLAGKNVKIEASEAFLNWLRTTSLSEYIGDEGEVTVSALTGLETTLIVISIVALVSGAGVGYMKGYEDGYEDGQEDGKESCEESINGDPENGNK